MKRWSLPSALSATCVFVAVASASGCRSTTLSSGEQGGRGAVRRQQDCNCDRLAAVDPGSGGVWRTARAGASERFWKHWGDGKAEINSYRITTLRYGAKREGHAALVFVTEPLNRETLIKDDSGEVPPKQRLQVLKLNHMLKFTTGIYPYSVMTSVFAPVADYGLPRFTPAKVAFSVQEWCGHVYQQIRPGRKVVGSSIRSYFSSEGERDRAFEVPSDVLYEDALLIQLRGLDGAFNGGQPWSGHLVPSLWRTRKAHLPLAAVAATIDRTEGIRAEKPTWRFELRFGEVTKTYEIEKVYPHRVLGWSQSDGEEAALLESVRLPYWQLNKVGDERFRRQLGLP
jgi:hypothetical protein